MTGPSTSIVSGNSRLKTSLLWGVAAVLLTSGMLLLFGPRQEFSLVDGWLRIPVAALELTLAIGLLVPRRRSVAVQATVVFLTVGGLYAVYGVISPSAPSCGCLGGAISAPSYHLAVTGGLLAMIGASQ